LLESLGCPELLDLPEPGLPVAETGVCWLHLGQLDLLLLDLRRGGLDGGLGPGDDRSLTGYSPSLRGPGLPRGYHHLSRQHICCVLSSWYSLKVRFQIQISYS